MTNAEFTYAVLTVHWQHVHASRKRNDVWEQHSPLPHPSRKRPQGIPCPPGKKKLMIDLMILQKRHAL